MTMKVHRHNWHSSTSNYYSPANLTFRMHSAKTINPSHCLNWIALNTRPSRLHPHCPYLEWQFTHRLHIIGLKICGYSQNLLFPSPSSPCLPASLLEVTILHLRSGVLPVTTLTYPYLTNLLSPASLSLLTSATQSLYLSHPHLHTLDLDRTSKP